MALPKYPYPYHGSRNSTSTSYVSYAITGLYGIVGAPNSAQEQEQSRLRSPHGPAPAHTHPETDDLKILICLIVTIVVVSMALAIAVSTYEGMITNPKIHAPVRRVHHILLKMDVEHYM
jgi:hypothetical protein